MFLKVKAITECKKEEVKEGKENCFSVFVKEKAEQGKANERIIELLSLHLKIPKEKLVIVKGRKGRSKIIKVY